MGGKSDGSRGGMPVVVGVRLTVAQAEKLDRMRGSLTRSEAARLALLEWRGLAAKAGQQSADVDQV